MYKILFVFFTVSILVLSIPVFGDEGVSVKIDQIISNVVIDGRVIGLTQTGAAAHKVVVYVKTDEWYIHPYATGGEGKSFASIESDGTWKIATVKREFEASDMAVLVVTKETAVPKKTSNLLTIPNLTMVVKKLEGTDDYGKL